MPRRTKNKRYPVNRIVSVAQASPAAANAFADVGALMSQTNHRLYRQSRYYEVSVTIDSNVADGTTIDIYALADNWWTEKALQMAKAAWDESNAEEKEMLDGKVARWNDFRVQTGLTGFGGLIAQQFAHTTLAAVPFTAGEFDNSQVVDQAGVTRTFTWGTPGAAEYSIMDEYDRSGNTSSDPTTPATGPYSGLLPNLEAGAADALQEIGNLAPYNMTGYGSGIWVKVGTLHLSAGRQRLSTGFFIAPCGFVAMTGVGWLDNPDIQIEVKRGDYKGVHAPTMLE